VEAHRSETSLQQYLSGEFSALLSERDFLEALPGHLLPDSVNQQRARIVLMRMQEIVGRR
jgi:hypothetical protein